MKKHLPSVLFIIMTLLCFFLLSCTGERTCEEMWFGTGDWGSWDILTGNGSWGSTGCADIDDDDDDDDDDDSPKNLLSLTVTSQLTGGKVGNDVYVEVLTNPEEPTHDPTGKNAFNPENVKCFVRLGDSDTYIPLQRQDGGYFYYTVTTLDDMTFYAVYCTHSETHYDGAGDLMSNGFTLVCHTKAIGTVEDLKALENASGTFMLTNDIDLTGVDWKPIENFTGTIHGNGFSIKNLTISAIDESNLGLFSTISQSTSINNLKITDAKITARGEGSLAGILAGSNEGTVEGVTAEGEISVKYYTNVGGLVGQNTGNIIGCKNYATVVGKNNVGGLAGTLNLASEVAIDGSENEGDISGKIGVGGIAGFLTSSTSNMSMTNIKNNGQIDGTDNVGGLFGEVNCPSFTLTLVTNNGVVNGDQTGSCTGGIVGRATDILLMSYCENYADITGNVYVGGLVGYAPGMIIKSAGFENNVSVCGREYVGGYAGYAGQIEAATNNGQVASLGITSSGKSYIGGIAGYCTGLIECINNADVVLNNSGQYVGGLAGQLHLTNGENLSKCQNNGIVSGRGSNIGGIAGLLSSSGAVTVSDNENNSEVSGLSSVGGLFGGASGNISYTLLTNNASVTGDLTGEGVGGIVGASYDAGEMFICENFGDISGFKYVGGLVGYAPNMTLKADDFVNNNDISGATYVGGVAGYVLSITGAKNNGQISLNGATGEYIGGVVGYANAVIGCQNLADLIFEGEVSYVGGVCGFVYTTGAANIKNNTNQGNVSAKEYVGGVLGYVLTPTPYLSNATYSVENCKNSAKVTGVSSVGGIIGHAKGVHRHQPGPLNYGDYFFYISVTVCVNEAEIIGETYVGGIVGSYSYLANDATIGETNSSLYGELLGH